MKAYEKNNMPQEIINGQNKYTYKDFLVKANKYRYRCIHRTCGCFIKISEEEVKKLKSGSQDKDINYEMFNQHSHKGTEITTIKANEIKTVEQIDNLAIMLIKQNITAPLDFHVKNFKNNNIDYSYNKIKNLLQKIRELEIPDNNEILANINNITINFNNNNKSEDEVPFCLSKGEFINLRYKNRIEKFVIFTSLLQLKIGAECDDYFIDGTFKACPKGWYQLLNIWAYKRNNNVYLPIANILLSQNSYELYDKVIKEFLTYSENFNIEINFKGKSIMLDFEHSLRNAIRNNLSEIKLVSCYFHYAKAIYKKCKDYHLFKKDKKNHALIVAFIFKIYPYIPTKYREQYLYKVKNYIENLDKGFTKLYDYFIKNWKNNKFFKFSEINDEQIVKRTNNVCESFHRHLNNTISHFHPKIGYLLIFNNLK